MIKFKSIRVPHYSKGVSEWHVVNRANHQLLGFIRFYGTQSDYHYVAYVKDDQDTGSHLLGRSLTQDGALRLIRNHYKQKETA